MIFVSILGNDRNLLQNLKKQNLFPAAKCNIVTVRVDYPHAICSTYPPEFGSLGAWLSAYQIPNKPLSSDVVIISN